MEETQIQDIQQIYYSFKFLRQELESFKLYHWLAGQATQSRGPNTKRKRWVPCLKSREKLFLFSTVSQPVLICFIYCLMSFSLRHETFAKHVEILTGAWGLAPPPSGWVHRPTFLTPPRQPHCLIRLLLQTTNSKKEMIKNFRTVRAEHQRPSVRSF